MQVRARINASGGTGSVSDTSIFDAALKAIAGNAGSGSKSSLDSSALVDTIVNQVDEPELTLLLRRNLIISFSSCS